MKNRPSSITNGQNIIKGNCRPVRNSSTVLPVTTSYEKLLHIGVKEEYSELESSTIDSDSDNE